MCEVMFIVGVIIYTVGAVLLCKVSDNNFNDDANKPIASVFGAILSIAGLTIAIWTGFSLIGVLV